MEFDSHGNFIKAFGAGMMLFPHGFFIDKADHIWVTDGQVGGGKGDDVLEFDRNGKVAADSRETRDCRQRVRHLS